MEVTTASWLRVTPASCRAPDRARPVKVSMAEVVTKSYMNLLERASSPEVRNTGWNPVTSSV